VRKKKRNVAPQKNAERRTPNIERRTSNAELRAADLKSRP
jgi:hypothetical protein